MSFFLGKHCENKHSFLASSVSSLDSRLEMCLKCAQGQFQCRRAHRPDFDRFRPAFGGLSDRSFPIPCLLRERHRSQAAHSVQLAKALLFHLYMHGGSGQKVTLGLLPIHSSNPFFETLAPPELVHDMRNAGFADGRPLWSGQRESRHLKLTLPFIAFFGGMGAKVAVPPHLAHHAASRSDSLPDSGSAAAGRGKGGGRLMWIEVIGKFLHGVYARVFDADILAIKDFNVKPH